MYNTRYEGSTGEVGEGDDAKNPAAPVGSRAYGSDFVHFIEDSQTSQTIIRFWFHEPPAATTMVPLAIDYQILKNKIPWLNNTTLTLSDNNVAQLITMVFFQQLMENQYQSKVTTLSFKAINSFKSVDLPYPKAPLQAEDIEQDKTRNNGIVDKILGLFERK